MKKKLLFLFLVLVMLITIGIIYLNQFFFPVKLKEIITQQAEEFLGRQVKFESITFNPIKGLVVKDINIAERDTPDIPFLTIKEISLTVLYAPIWREKKIIIPSIIIDHPSINVTRTGENEWNYSDLLRKSSKPDGGKSPFSFFLGGVQIRSGDVVLVDKTVDPPELDTFEETNLKVSLSTQKGISFSAETTLPRTSSYLSLNGHSTIDLSDIDAEANISGINLARYYGLYIKNSPLKIDSALIKNAQARIKRLQNNYDVSAQFSVDNVNVHWGVYQVKGHIASEDLAVTVHPEALNLAGILKINDGSIDLGEGRTIAGDLELNSLNYSHPVANSPQEIKANLLLKNSQVRLGESQKLSGQIGLADGVVHFSDGNFDLKGNLKADDFLYSWEEGSQIQGQLIATPLSLSSSGGKIRVNGSPELASGSIILGADRKITGNITLKNSDLTQDKNNLSIKADVALSDGNIQWDGKKFAGGVSSSQAELKKENTNIHVRGLFEFSDARLELSPEQILTGAPQLQLSLDYSPEAPTPLSYSGSLTPKLKSISGIPYAGQITDVDGNIDFETDNIHIKDLDVTAFDSQIHLAGTVHPLSDPTVDIKASTEWVDLQKALALVPDLRKKIPVSPQGRGKFQIAYAGKPSAFAPEDLSLQATIDGTTLSGASLPSPISQIKGELSMEKDGLSWKNLSANFMDYDFLLDGNLENLKHPAIETQIQSHALGLDVKTNFKVLEKKIDLNSLVGQLHHSKFDLTGRIDLPQPEAGLAIDCDGTADFDLNDLKDIQQIPEALQKQWKELKPLGMIHWKGKIAGEPQDWKNLKAEFTADSPQLSVSGYKLDDVNLRYDQARGKLNQMVLNATVYEGKLTADATADLLDDALPGNLNLNLNRTNLEKLKNDTPVKDKQISGFLSSVFRVSGPLTNVKKLEGDGSLSISEGNIWQLNLLKGLGKLLLIQEFEDIVFHEANGDFKIQNGRMTTNNLVLSSDPLNVSAKGWVSFDGELDFDVVSEFNPETIVNSESLKKKFTAIIAQTGQFMNVKISGSVKDPKYNVLPSPVHVIEKTKDLLLDGIQSIF